jgi:signal transduction histidine kinase
VRRIKDVMHSIAGRLPFLGSFRLRIFLFSFLLGCIPCSVMQAAILSGYEEKVISIQTSEVQTQLRVLANHLLTYDYLNNPTSSVVDAELEQFASFYDGRVLVINRDLKVVKDTFDMSTGKIVVSGDVVRCLQKGNKGISTSYVKEDGYLEVIMPVSETKALENQDYSGNTGQEETTWGVLLVSVSADSVAATLDALQSRFQIVWMLLAAVVFAVSIWGSGRLVRPIRRLVASFRDVQAGYTSSDVNAEQYRETRELASAFNEVIGRMRSLDESRQEFVSNVSHELKTPMTSMKVLADSLLQMGDGVPNKMYREFLQDIDGELDRENRMIEDLLTLTKLDQKQGGMHIAKMDISEIALTAAKRIRPLAEQKDVELVVVSEREIYAEVDENKMMTILTNLMENAVKYNRERGTVTVTLDADNKQFTISVKDTGIGIPGNAQDKIFERFYRVDTSRSREVGGTGLGLSIVRSAVLLHRGSIRVESGEGLGTEMVVSIPLTYAVQSGENHA